jgi:ribosomal-protein-alanine N-acetyltransferase
LADLVVTGPTVRLRYATAEDAPRFFALARDPEVTRFFSWAYERPEQAQEWIASLPARREAGDLLDFAIEYREHGVVGSTGLSECSVRDRRAMVGTWLGREHWGAGVNAEAKALVCALAFRTLGLERVGAYTSPDNPRSERALARLGFVREGLLREWHRHGGESRDVIIHGLLRAEWEASPLHAVPAEVTGDPPAAWRCD